MAERKRRPNKATKTNTTREPRSLAAIVAAWALALDDDGAQPRRRRDAEDGQHE